MIIYYIFLIVEEQHDMLNIMFSTQTNQKTFHNEKVKSKHQVRRVYHTIAILHQQSVFFLDFFIATMESFLIIFFHVVRQEEHYVSILNYVIIF